MSLRTETRSYGGKTYEACVDALMPEDAVITDNVLVGVANPLGNISARVKELGTVEDNTTFPAGTDIGFVNADGQNFEVRADSKIKELLGDEHFQASEAGLYVDEYRTNLGVPVTAPTAKSPENNAEVSIASGVTFSWQAGEGAGSYLLEISESDDFESLAFSASTRQTSLRVLDLEKNKTYFWRVTAFEDRLGGNSAVSGISSFSTADSDEVVLYESFGDAEFPLWSAEGGTPTRTDAAAHAGRYSYLVDESKDVIRMEFASPQKKTVSLWLYDTMEAKANSVVVANAAPSQDGWAALGVNARISTDHYIFRTGSTWTITAVSRSEGWHELKWDYRKVGWKHCMELHVLLAAVIAGGWSLCSRENAVWTYPLLAGVTSIPVAGFGRLLWTCLRNQCQPTFRIRIARHFLVRCGADASHSFLPLPD